MVGPYDLHSEFKPKGCNTTIKTTAVTAGAASYVSDVYSHLDQYNLTLVDGMGPEVTMGGYLTGGGHSPLSNIFGLGSDQIYEVEMVTPTGEILTANECQNIDLFWAVRGVSNKFNFISFLCPIWQRLLTSLGRWGYFWSRDQVHCSYCSI
jgi:FAD/FMN-containing dehydrogenase